MDIRLADIVDVPLLQEMFDSLWRANGIPLGLIDADGEVLVAIGWQEVCTEYHARHPETGTRCLLNHLPQLRDVVDHGLPAKPREFPCINGLIDICLPIVCDGKFLGAFFLGQFLDRPPDPERFRRQALQLGFKPDHYLALIERVPVIPRSTVEQQLAFHGALIRLLAESGMNRLRAERARRELAAAQQALHESEERFRSIVQALPLGIHMYRLEEDGRLIFAGANPAADAILGVDNSVFVGRELLDAFPRLAGTEIPGCYQRVCTTGEPWQAEQIDYADGTVAGAFEVHAFRTGPKRMASVFMDIGERVRSVAAIRTSEETLHAILAAAPLCIGMSVGGLFRWVNPWMLKELGYAENDLIGKSPCLLYETEEEFRRVMQVRETTLATGQMAEVETRWRQGDGRIIDVLLRFMGVAPEIMPAGVIFAALNITVSRRAAAELRDREERIRLLLNASGEGIFGVDRNGCCTFANPMCLDMLGIADENQLLGRNTHRLMHHTRRDGSSHPEEECPVYNTFRRGQPVHVVGEMFWRSDGTGFPVEYWAHPVDKGGEVQGAVVNFIDITERQRAEQRLEAAFHAAQRAREQLNAIVHSAADALVVIDPQGRILNANSAAIDLFGGDPGQVVGMPLAGKFDDPQLLERIGRIIAGAEQSATFDLAAWKDAVGRERTLQARVARIDEAGHGLYGVVAILRDVTREREIDRLKDDFISTAAHELRTPVTSILGYAEIILDLLPQLSGEQLREYLGVICNRSMALTQIVEEMLDLSRMQSGQVIRLVRQPGDLGELARQAVGHHQMASPGHAVQLDVAGQLPSVEFDGAKLRQVFDNLLSNACKFSPRGSEVTVSVGVAGREAVVSVVDRGVGMTPEQVERVFDKFYRADASTTAASGLGLGMSLVKGIIEGHGGRIWVESAPGYGTTVSFALPLESGGEQV